MIEFDPTLVHEWLSRSAKRHPEKLALIYGDTRLTYEELDRWSSELACSLIGLGLQRQDRVAIFMDNSCESVISLYGILKAGGAFVMISNSVKAHKLRYVLEDSGAKHLIVNTSKARVAAACLTTMSGACLPIWVGPKERVPEDLRDQSLYWEDCIGGGQDRSVVDAIRAIDIDLATLIYTSGSTGEAKGIMSTHHNMISAARSIVQYINNEPDDVILSVLPLSFDYGLYQVIMAMMFGGTVVLETSFVYVDRILKRVAQEQVTGFPIVPTIVAMLLRMDDLDQYELSSLRYMTNTGAALPVEHIQRLRERLPHVTIYSMFGLTECKRVSYLPVDQIAQRPDSVGKAIPNCETMVVDERGNSVAPGEMGELVIRGSNVMQGYWNSPELTAKAYHPGAYPADRRLYSGDTFRMDEEGFLYFLGRHDDMIKCKGERVSAKEVENVLHAMPEISEAAVMGVPDKIQGQAIIAFVVPKDDVTLSERDVAKYCTQNLESFMIPSTLEFMSALPRTTNGKIDKKLLHQNAMTLSAS